MKLGVLILSGILFLTGCSSTGASAEQAVKIVEYEKCLEYQQSLVDDINEALQSALGFTEEEVIKVFDGQREGMGPFKKSLENCLPYRP
jgi:PBP1b-binding outer membrane lipoprotein LpoB